MQGPVAIEIGNLKCSGLKMGSGRLRISYALLKGSEAKPNDRNQQKLIPFYLMACRYC
jgi:hypothetical protein